MALLPAAAIVRRIHELLVEGAGVHRVIPAGTYAAGSVAASRDGARSVESLDDSPRVRARVISDEQHPASPGSYCSRTLRQLTIEITVTRAAGVGDTFGETERRALLTACLEDQSRIRQALEWPGNLAATEGGDPTGISGRKLVASATEFTPIEYDLGENHLVESQQLFTAVVCVDLEAA
jgi:hypothetical protein